ncbi:MAG: MlaD family protein [Hyphomonadaceae bacterium]
MSERLAETILGAIVAAIAVVFFVFASAQAKQGGGAANGVDYVARFQRVDGVSVGSDVRVSGVKVGVVKTIALDPTTYMAKLTLSIDSNVHVLDDSVARIASDGLLGGAYVSIEPTGLDPLPPGGEIVNTQGSVDLLTLLASAVGNASAGQHAQPPPQGAAP